ncbi:MAG: PhnD/SsuA/transferrin family substrate-binding protein [Geobacteraceae bacterium]|jgi:ABC-type phosphate/phosphonate transport system substrate-binding protein
MLCAVLLLPTATLGEAPITGAELQDVVPKVLRMGFSTRILSDIDPRDAQVAMELWTKELGRSMGIKTELQTVIFKKTAEMIDAVKKGELTILSLPAIDYLKIRDEVGLTPSVVSTNNAGKRREFVLITRRDSGIRTVADLRGRMILLLSPAKEEVSHLWLDVLLMREGNRDRASFFRQVKEATSASQAIMAVFFRQADGAIVSRGALETSNTLNPQIGSQLFIVAETKPLLGDITCIPITVNEKLKRSIEHAGLHLHENTVGKQIFTLFHIDRTIPFQPSYLDGISDLLREYARLKAKTAKRKMI